MTSRNQQFNVGQRMGRWGRGVEGERVEQMHGGVRVGEGEREEGHSEISHFFGLEMGFVCMG